MIQGKLSDKKEVLDILEYALKDNPTVTAFSRSKNGKIYIRPLLEYAFHFSLARAGVYLSDNRDCVAFFYPSSAKGTWKEKYYFIKFVLCGVKILKIPVIQKHLNKIKALKPQAEDYFYFWFLGAKKGSSLKSSLSFIHEIMQLALDQNKTIYAETTVDKNERVFARFGMKEFQKVSTPELGVQVHLMRMEVEK